MNRWSIGNYILPITHRQFIALTEQFKTAAERSFGTTCNLEIEVLREAKLYTTFVDDEIQSNLDSINLMGAIHTANIQDVTTEVWKKAGHVTVTLRPADPTKTHPHAFAVVEFKGVRPRQATYYIQPRGEMAAFEVLDNNRFKLIGDGHDGNGTRSSATPYFGF